MAVYSFHLIGVMPFVKKGGAFQILNSIEKGGCAGECRKVWLRNIQYALKAKSNPLKLTPAERRRMTAKVSSLKRRRVTVKRGDPAR